MVSVVLRLRAVLACLLLVLPIGMVRAENLVTLRALADPAYVAARATASGLRPETYVVMKGRFFGGVTSDRSLERMPFSKVAALLSHDLKRQAYLPARDLASADLLLVIHWGVTVPSVAEYEENMFRDSTTTGITDARERYTEAVANGDVKGAEDAMADLQGFVQMREHEAVVFANDAMTGAFIGNSNAELLGLKQELHAGREDLFNSTRAETVDLMCKEERYFIIVLAFDARHLREHGKLRRLWTARLSTRAAGINFAIALDRMSDVGGRYFGQRVEGVPFERVRSRTEKIVYGELEVIELGTP